MPDILQYATIKATLEELDGTPIINLSQVPLQGWHSLVKRVVDLALSARRPARRWRRFFPLIALLIWLEDRGPIFYSQERMGLDGRPFMIWKFRSMRRQRRGHAPVRSGRSRTTRAAPASARSSAAGRSTSCRSSGTCWWATCRSSARAPSARPSSPSSSKHLPQYMLRHRVKSGITGWAQVHGWRGNTSIRKRLEFDLYYIENWSLGLDFKILWMTLRHGLRHNAH